MSEIKIEEQRFLSLISSEKLVPKIVNVFISHLISEWKRTHSFKTELEREPIAGYIQKELDNVGVDFKVGFNNTYNCMILFRYKGEGFVLPITSINPSNGESTE